MKKLALALLCLFSVAFFASCNKPVDNPEPSIAIMTGDNFVYDGQTIAINTDYHYGFRAASNSQTMKELASIRISGKFFDVNGNETGESGDTTFAISGTEYVYQSILNFDFRELIGKAVITATVTDVNGKYNSLVTNLNINQPATPLISRTIEWVRKGANVLSEQEMAACGLKWEGTYKAPFATIKPIDGATLYVCNGNLFEDITTDVEKAAFFTQLIETGTPAESYRNVDANQSADYNDMLAVVKDDLRVVIIIKRADIETGSFGTQITIKGEAK